MDTRSDLDDKVSPDLEWELTTRGDTKNMTLERRITHNTPGLGGQFQTGGYIQPAQIPAIPTVRHRAEFNSRGTNFTVNELKSVLNKLGTAGNATVTFETVHGIRINDEAPPITKAVVEWTA